jgi:hypothetical protein
MQAAQIFFIAACLQGPVPVPADRIEPIGMSIPADKLSPADVGLGYIESMDEAIARDHDRPSDPDYGDNYRGDEHGTWNSPSIRATYYPNSGIHNVTNKWGDTRMGIGFRGVVDVRGVYVSGQAAQGAWTTGLRAVGYLNGTEVASTPWFRDIDDTPSWFNIDFQGVDRIVFEAEPVIYGAGWYAIDDLTFARHDAGGQLQPDTIVDFEDTSFSRKLSGTNYAGLIWETGTGDFTHRSGLSVRGAGRAADPAQGGLDSLLPSTRGGGGSLPNLTTSFVGVVRGQAGQFSYPPDTCGAVGPTQFVVTVNRNFAVYNKVLGTQITNISLGSFLPGSNGDPRVLFLQYSGRWFVIVSDFNARIYLAVSAHERR